MAEKTKSKLLQAIIFSHFLVIVICFGYTFQRIDENDDNIATIGFTKIFHQCSLDSTCNFVVKPKKNSDLEKRQTIDDVATLYNVWKKGLTLRNKLF